MRGIQIRDKSTSLDFHIFFQFLSLEPGGGGEDARARGKWGREFVASILGGDRPASTGSAENSKIYFLALAPWEGLRKLSVDLLFQVRPL
jgi:hypothetical protein